VEIHHHNTIDELLSQFPSEYFFFATTKAGRLYTSVRYTPSSFLVFGKETQGLPVSLLARYPDQCIRIPMVSATRSLNLSNAVAVVVYEALRQQGFPGLV